MPERRTPYVGVSGIVSPDQEIGLSHEMFNRDGDTMLALGVKAVHKTQWFDALNKYGERWYPVGEAGLRQPVSSDTNYNIAQVYLDPEAIEQDQQYPRQFIHRLRQRGAAWLDAVQFDLLPYVEYPEAFDHLVHDVKRHGFDVIVQCHAGAMAEGPRKAIEKLNRLSPDEIDYVLFDASHGTGAEMNPDQLLHFLEAAYSNTTMSDSGTNFGIAGGLDATMVEKYLPTILSRFPFVSWDAEGKLHRTPDGSLDLSAAKAYLNASAEVIRDI